MDTTTLKQQNVKIGRWRWAVALILFFIATVNYIDRVNISYAAPYIQQDYHINDFYMGIILSSVVWAYAIMQLPMGYLVDKFRAKRMLGYSQLSWGIVSMLTSLGFGFGSFLAFRLFLGASESPAFPTSAKVTSYWFPEHERGQAIGLYLTGVFIGPMFASALIGAMIFYYGFRAMFVLTGAFAIVVVIFWFIYYHDPSDEKRVTKQEISYIFGNKEDTDNYKRKIPWKTLYKYPSTIGLLVGNFFLVYVSFMLLTWMPSFLVDTYHLTILDTGIYATLPYAGGAIGFYTGGKIGDYLIQKRNWETFKARKTLIIIGAALTMEVFIASITPSLLLSITVLTLSLFTYGIAGGNTWMLVASITSKENVGSVGGIMNFGGYVGSAVAPVVTGFLLLYTKSFVDGFAIAAIFVIISALIYGLVVNNFIGEVDSNTRITTAMK